MAAVVESVTPTGDSTVQTNSVVDLPAVINAGDWLVILARETATGTFEFPVGWVEKKDVAIDASNDRMAAAVRLADGTEGTTITVTHGNARSAYLVLRISGGDPNIEPEFSADVSGASAAPDPPSLTPTGGAKDYLWLWFGGWEGEQTSPPAGSPTNYTSDGGADTGIGGATAGNCRVAAAHRALNAASEDPPSWTISVADDWGAWTVAVHPAPAGGTAHSRTISDPLGLDDSEVRSIASSRSLTDAVGLLDSHTRVAASVRSVVDPLGSLDAVAFVKSVQKTITDPLGFLDATAQVSSTSRTVADNIGLLDPRVQTTAFLRTLTDPLGLLDSVVRTGAYVRTLSDSLGLLDDVTARIIVLAVVTDALGLVDSSSSVQAMERTIVDPLGLTDLAVQTAAFVRELSDMLGIDDEALRTLVMTRVVTDLLGLSDNAVGAVGGAAKPGSADVGDAGRALGISSSSRVLVVGSGPGYPVTTTDE